MVAPAAGGHGSPTLMLPATRLTPLPRPLSDVAPLRLVPVNVKLRALLPWSPVAVPAGFCTPVRVGPSTVKPPVRVAVPPGVVMLTLWAPRVAPVVMVKVAVAVVEFTTVRLLPVMPVPAVTAVAAVRSVPVRVTLTAG